MPKHLARPPAAPRRGVHDLVIVMATVGLSLGFLLFPAAANWVNARAHAEEISTWTQTITNAHPTEIAELLEAAEQYNERLAAGLEGLVDEWDETYRAVLSQPGTRVISRVVIPAINVALPIFHGTADDVLDLGVGHLYGTSLPVGNANNTFGTHSVITAHSGVDTNALFNDLHDLAVGDIFMVDTAGSHMFYQVDEITIVPEDILKTFDAKPGQDLVTLLTCTPIGINSHRLLVRGTRYFPEQVQAEKIIAHTPQGEQFPTFALAWATPTLISGGIWHLATKKRR